MQTPKYGTRQIAIAQRAEIHVGLSDDLICALATHTVPGTTAAAKQNAAKTGSKAGAS